MHVSIVLSHQLDKSNTDLLHRPASRIICQCPPNPATPLARVPTCSCPPITDVSSLYQIRWKRLIVDEGHNSHSQKTNIFHVVAKLSVQSKWIITGTPTPHLIGSISASRSGSSIFEGSSVRDGGSLMDVDGDSMERDAGGSSKISTRPWDPAEEEDLTRLGKMITDWLCVQPFHSSKTHFRQHVVETLKAARMGATRVLAQTMGQCMIRHP